MGMKIALVVLTRGSVSGGFRKYLQRMVPLLREQPEVEWVEVFLPPQMAGAGDRTWPVRDELRAFRTLRRSIAALGPDVVFVPTARMLRTGPIALVTMVRNMEPLEVTFHGNGPVEILKNVGRGWAANRAVRNSDRVIAVSNHVRDFLMKSWHVPDTHIGVVPHGIDRAPPPAAPPPRLAALAEAPFLFTAGSIRPARGLQDVIAALADVPGEYKLVIAGSVDRGAEHYDRAMRELARRCGVDARVEWVGQLDAAAMAWCFRKAAAFVMTSRAEACPNIVLEAMAAGALAISTDHPPMPEFFGDAAVYYRARDAAHLAERLAVALVAPKSLRSLRARATQRAAAFTWEATARGTVLELQRAIESCASFT